MSIFLRLSTLALRGVVVSASAVSGLEVGGAGLDGVIGFLSDRFRDQSGRLEAALRLSNRRAWDALEAALAGPTLWQRMGVSFARADDRAFADQVRAFLEASPLPAGDHKLCLAELRAAREQFIDGRFDHAELARQAGDFARFADPASQLEAEWDLCTALADDLRRQGYGGLAGLIGQRPAGGPPLLVAAVRYFFRRAVEEDAELFRGLTFTRLEALADAQAAQSRVLEDVRAMVSQLAARPRDWLTDTDEFTDATHRYWMSGRADALGPHYRRAAEGQSRSAFAADVAGPAWFIEQSGYPLFRDEALLGGGKGMVLTTYRLVLTTPKRRVACVPLADVDDYRFDGAGTVLGLFAGGELRLNGRFGRCHWRGGELNGLEFPRTEYVDAARRLEEWRPLPEDVRRSLGRRRGGLE